MCTAVLEPQKAAVFVKQKNVAKYRNPSKEKLNDGVLERNQISKYF